MGVDFATAKREMKENAGSGRAENEEIRAHTRRAATVTGHAE